MRSHEFLTEGAVEELKRRMPQLPDYRYKTIGDLMIKISKKHGLDAEGKQLHDMWVKRHNGMIPDDWVKRHHPKIKKRTDEIDTDGLQHRNEGAHRGNDPRIQEFVKWCCSRLNIDRPPQFEFSTDTQDAQDNHHTGGYRLGSDTIWVYVKNRNLVDILRTIAHELTHYRQDQIGMIKPGSSRPGSGIELTADMMAGTLVKIWGRKHHDIFEAKKQPRPLPKTASAPQSPQAQKSQYPTMGRRKFLGTMGAGLAAIPRTGEDARDKQLLTRLHRVFDKLKITYRSLQKKYPQFSYDLDDLRLAIARGQSEIHVASAGTASLSAALTGASHEIKINPTLFYEISDDGIAFVLAHEIGHVVLRHHRAIFDPKYWTDNTKSVAARSREFEHEADVFGAKLAHAAGYNPARAFEVWNDFLKEIELLFPQGTHPPYQQRIDHIRKETGIEVSAVDLHNIYGALRGIRATRLS